MALLEEDGFVTLEFRKLDGQIVTVQADLYEVNGALFGCDRKFPEPNERLAEKGKVFRKLFGLGDDYKVSQKLVVQFCKEVNRLMDEAEKNPPAGETTPGSPASTEPPSSDSPPQPS